MNVCVCVDSSVSCIPDGLVQRSDFNIAFKNKPKRGRYSGCPAWLGTMCTVAVKSDPCCQDGCFPNSVSGLTGPKWPLARLILQYIWQETAIKTHPLFFNFLSDVANLSLSQYVMLLNMPTHQTCHLIKSRWRRFLGTLEMFCNLGYFFFHQVFSNRQKCFCGGVYYKKQQLQSIYFPGWMCDKGWNISFSSDGIVQEQNAVRLTGINKIKLWS